jgi:hypothetical protein
MEVLGSIKKEIIYNGENFFEVPDGYGENEWYFSYRDTLTGYLRHIKTNRNDHNHYMFQFYEKEGECFVKVNIAGSSSLEKVIKLERQ